MSRNKQIEEIAVELGGYNCKKKPCKGCGVDYNCIWFEQATRLYNTGYRKASEVAREIIKIVQNGAKKYINDITLNEGIRNMLSIMLDDFVYELKKKYTENKGD